MECTCDGKEIGRGWMVPSLFSIFGFLVLADAMERRAPFLYAATARVTSTIADDDALKSPPPPTKPYPTATAAGIACTMTLRVQKNQSQRCL